ncbi:S8 family serine peptidase [Bacillus sp. REN10]|uniref:S8 family serine peptidase n=1 Tax=Bacillus sp. REN10 TaxID=2782541 RepID=UPI00193BCCCC|nr:S8 family serine peptidase [Bacillus sp. REN10]
MYQFCMDKGKWGNGRGIKIAHIDSGINEWHPHIGKVAGGIAFEVTDQGKIVLEESFQDGLGHGTAVAGVIKEQVPEAELWAVKIFHERLTTYIEVLCVAIEWCIEQKMDIINLSLGVNQDIAAFRHICEQANEAGIFIVSACDEQNGLYWPGYYPSIYAVRSAKHGRSGVFHFSPDEPIAFQTVGVPRSLEGPLQKFNYQGHSFAAAHVTGMMAKVKEKYSEIKTVSEMNQLFIKLSEQQTVHQKSI